MGASACIGENVALQSVIRRVDVDALHLPGVVRQQRLERDQVVPLHHQIPAAGIAHRQRLVALEQPIRNLAMMVPHRLLPNPIERRHAEGFPSGVIAGRAPTSSSAGIPSGATLYTRSIGGDTFRLHEEIIATGGFIKDAKWGSRLNVGQTESALEGATDKEPSAQVKAELLDLYPQLSSPLASALEARMMRLVFLFCAEERELIPSKPFPVYEQNYSVSTISKQLRELADQHGEELLERRYDAWPRLLAAFRAVYGGLQHDDVYIPAYGGSLFNPDRFPFLEGRKSDTSWRDIEANPLPVNNRTVLHLLEALQLLQIKMPGGGKAEARRLSFRALDIEQIGHVYEGLLDHTAKRAAEPFLGLAGTRAKEPEFPLAQLEKLLASGSGEPSENAALLKFLKEETGKTEKALGKSLKTEFDSVVEGRFRTACQGDDALWKRVKPLAGLVRLDNFGYPVVIPKGSVFVTAGTDRRSSGTHYTPRSLTEPIVQYTLEPLVYVGPAEGLPKSDWQLKSAKELLDLKICDMACGSGAFLVQTARYMAERLMEAWEIAKQANPTTPKITPEGEPSTAGLSEGLIPDGPAERKTYAMRIIAQRCLYGVDINPLAAEMAKLSLWLLTVAKDKPFEFLDHSIRCGDSLVGLHSLDQLRHFSLKPDADDAMLFGGPLDESVDEAISLRLRLEDLPAHTVEDVERQEKLLKEAHEKIARLRCAADLLVAAEFWGGNAKDKLERVRHAAVVSGQYIEHGPTKSSSVSLVRRGP